MLFIKFRFILRLRSLTLWKTVVILVFIGIIRCFTALYHAHKFHKIHDINKIFLYYCTPQIALFNAMI